MAKLRLPSQQGKSRLTLLSVALLMVLLLSGVKGFSQASINATGAAPDGSAMLDVSGSTTGVLINRMNTVQMNAITSPATGLTIFNVDCNVFYYNAGTPSVKNWIPISTTSNSIGAPGAITGLTSVCPSAAGVVYSIAPVNGATSYTWTVPAGSTFTYAGTSITVTFGTTSGNVSVSAYVSSCEKSPTSSLAVSIISTPALTAGTISGTLSVCPGTATTLSVAPSGGNGTYAYQWLFGGNPVPSATNVTFNTGPINSPVVYNESFDSPAFPPAGWSTIIEDPGTSGNAGTPYGPPFNWLQTNVGIYIPAPNPDPQIAMGPHSGAGMAWYDSWDSPGNAVLVTPADRKSVV